MKTSSSSAKSSSSSAKSSSSETESASSNTPIQGTSSSSESGASVFGEKSSSSAADIQSSSSSEGFLELTKPVFASSVKFFVKNKVLRIEAKLNGNKTVRLFDANGALLMTKAFDGESCEIHMDALLKNSLVFATLERGGRLVKSYKVRVN